MTEASSEVVVVKYGSTTVANEHGMNIMQLRGYSTEIAHLMLQYQVAIVSSGSIAMGRAMWSGGERPTEAENFAAVGSAEAFISWQQALAEQSLTDGSRINAGQVPVTDHEINSEEGLVLRRRLFSLMCAGIVPVANGNDVLSGEGAKDIKIDTDNDRLAGHIAELLNARHLILLMNRAGLLDREGNVVNRVGNSYKNLAWALSLAREDGDGERGGIRSKIMTAFKAARLRGIAAHIAHAEADLPAVLAGHVGTHFEPRGR
jgi:glutamate 5-kinase